MKKVKIVLIALLLGIVMIFGVAGCNIDTQNDLQGKIDDLQTQIEELEERLAEMEDQFGDRDKKIEQLEKELAEKSTGTFYTLREAFVNGWLTREDIMSIAYYHNGGRWHNEEIMSEDYEPAPKKPEVLSEFTELKIKSTGAKYCRENYDIAEAEADGITITQYCGTYGDCVAVMIRGYLHYAQALWTDTVAGINIHYSDANSIKIWRETNGKEEEQSANGSIDGAYFITDESYECYVRNCAAQIGADEQWITDVLNGGDGGEWHYMIRPQSWFRCVIADNQISVSKVEDTVYDISSDGSNYQGTSIIQTVTFWFDGDILYLKDDNETLQYRKDSSYQRTEAIILEAPQNVTVHSGGEGLNFITFQWNYQSDYGRVGAAIEIKTSGSQEYKAVQKIERIYMNELVVQLDESNFETGVNWVRIYHIGGPSITNDHSIIVEKNSDYTVFCVTVSNNGSVKVEEINF